MTTTTMSGIKSLINPLKNHIKVLTYINESYILFIAGQRKQQKRRRKQSVKLSEKRLKKLLTHSL